MARNQRSPEYHEKNKEVCREIMNEYSTTNMSWENIFKMYGIANAKFHNWIRKYDMRDELESARRKAKSSHAIKLKRTINDRILQDIKNISKSYADKPITWEQACKEHGINYHTFRDNCRRYDDVIGHVMKQAKIDHQRNKVVRIQEQADYAVEKAMDALVKKLDKRVVHELQEKTSTQKVGRRTIKNATTTKKSKTLDADMTAITTVLKMAGLLNEQQQIIVQNQIDVIGTKTPMEIEFDQQDDYDRLRALGIEDAEIIEN